MMYNFKLWAFLLMPFACMNLTIEYWYDTLRGTEIDSLSDFDNLRSGEFAGYPIFVDCYSKLCFHCEKAAPSYNDAVDKIIEEFGD